MTQGLGAKNSFFLEVGVINIVPRRGISYQDMLSVWQSLLVSEPLDQVSEWINIAEAANLLGLPPGKVRRLIEEHHLIGIKRSGEVMIPAEIIINAEPLHSLRGTILVLLDSGFSLQGAIDWLYTTNETLGNTPMQSLIAGRKSEVRRLAQSLAL